MITDNIIKTKVDWFEIYTFKNDGIGKDIINGKIWEKHIVEFLKTNLEKHSTFMDVGSNYGWHSIIASKYCDKVYSFEPQKIMFDTQTLSINDNNIKNIIIYNFGLGNENITSEMNQINYDSSWVNIGDLSVGTGGEQINIKTIDSLDLPKIDFIKIDVQGYEKFVLEGGIETIKKDKPTLIVELENFQLIKFGHNDSDIFTLLKDIGYIPFYLEYIYPSDHIFVHKDNVRSFIQKNNIQPLTEKNYLNNNLVNGVTNKIITNY
jgi:FkbM family methyltransferase